MGRGYRGDVDSARGEQLSVVSAIAELAVVMGVVMGAVLAGSEGPVVAEGFATAPGKARHGGHNSPMSPAFCARIEL